MSSSAKHNGRVIRAAAEHEDIFVLGESARGVLPAHGAVATANDLVDAATRRAEAIIADAEAEAAGLVAQARAEAAAVRAAATAEGERLGLARADEQVAGYIEIARRAANEGQAIRDAIAGQSIAVVARAAALATRRIVGGAYEADPELTAIACEDALRAASGQDVLAIRVAPGMVGSVQAWLADAATYVRPDEGVAIGGCIIDLRNGTLDASLDARLSLMELALGEAAGTVDR
ncbi:MAG: hypothetical protein HYX53_15590 [Chloroflexi bacterium]|nr:hypothetical protein [Chloroflexota bacterium]